VHFHCAINIPSAISRDEKRLTVQQALQQFLKRCVPSACIDIKPCDLQWLEYILKNVTTASMLYIRGLSRPNLGEPNCNVMVR